MKRNNTNIIGESGFALFTTLIIVIVVGIIAVSGLRQNELTEVLSGNSIQRSRAFQAAEGSLIEGENSAKSLVQNRVFSTSDATDGVFTRGSVKSQWWRDSEFSGAQAMAVTDFPGVFEPPEYVVEEIGNYEADGSSGIVNLDRGAAAYGRRSGSGREVVLFRFQARGKGSSEAAQAVVESIYVQNQ
jgi:type IV pilus assembly protein PilX